MNQVKCLTQIINKKGLHARAAAEIVNVSSQFQSHIIIEVDGKQATANSLIQLLLLAGSKGKDIHVIASGSDSQQAVDALISLIQQKFFEEE